VSSGMLRRVALVKTDISEQLSASFIRVIRIGQLGTLTVTSNRSKLLLSVRRLLHGVISKRTAFFKTWRVCLFWFPLRTLFTVNFQNGSRTSDNPEFLEAI
jgi:hypothetical protein